MKRVVQFSGGLGSWAAAKRVAARYGTSDLVLLFADVKDEHPDLYRFLSEGAKDIGVAITTVSDGRTPLEVMSDEGFIGNSAKDPCSKILKRRLLDRWCKENCDPSDTVRYIGIDWTESHRLETFRKRVQPWTCEAPMTEAPYMSKDDMGRWARACGLATPSLYDLGFHHNNCGGACIKAGQAQWALLLKHDPARYERWEQWEGEMRERVGDHSILRDRRGGTSKSLTLKDFRIRVEAKQAYDQHEFGSCGCGF